MDFAIKSRLLSAVKTGFIALGVYGVYTVYARFEDLAQDGQLILDSARKAQALAFLKPESSGTAGDSAFESFQSSYYSLGRALSTKALASPVNRAVFRAAGRKYYAVLPLAEDFYLNPDPGGRKAAGKELKARLERIAGTCLLAADRNTDERDLLLEKTALAAFIFLLGMAAFEGAGRCLICAPFLEELETLRRRIRRFAWPPQAAPDFKTEVEEMRAGTEAIERGLQGSMLDRLRLAKESAGRRARMKTQTRALEITRRKVIELVENLDSARAQLQKEKLNLKETGEKLARSNKELEQFAYVASHDLKEPLRVISSFSGLLSRRYTGRLSKEADDFIRYIEEGSQRGQEFVNALFNYSKVSQGGQKLAPTDCLLVLKKVMFNLQVTLKEKNAKVTWDELPTVRGDEIQLLQLFQNLLSNALKFNTSAAPEIKISCSRSRDGWLLGFADNGIGIPEEQYGRIFLIFQRLHAADKYPGAGIGLALCKKIAENHGGSIRVESVQGKGTTFWVTLPAAAQGAQEYAAPAASRASKETSHE